MLKSLEIRGLRGYSDSQALRFAQPNGQPGSGLTIIVGPNNAGKSTFIEGLQTFATRTAPSISDGRRNRVSGDEILVRMELVDGRCFSLKSRAQGFAEMVFDPIWEDGVLPSMYVLSSRRNIQPYFGRYDANRDHYINGYMGLPSQRPTMISGFEGRLFQAQYNRVSFNALLSRFIDPAPDWGIDLNLHGQHYLKFQNGNMAHSSEGIGDGVLNIFCLVDALYDSPQSGMIAIDEPELSLHPSLQRKIAQVISEYASDRQIVISTHSPYFVDMQALANGATIARVVKQGDRSILHQASNAALSFIRGVLDNFNNPHIWGLKAQEVFFLQDQVILVEGQEDILYMGKVLSSVGVELPGDFFGWGVGGAGNMKHIARLLREMGFSKVVGIFDADKRANRDELSNDFPSYKFVCLPANDIRTKRPRAAYLGVDGVLDENNHDVRQVHMPAVTQLLEELRGYLSDTDS